MAQDISTDSEKGPNPVHQSIDDQKPDRFEEGVAVLGSEAVEKYGYVNRG